MYHMTVKADMFLKQAIVERTSKIIADVMYSWTSTLPLKWLNLNKNPPTIPAVCPEVPSHTVRTGTTYYPSVCDKSKTAISLLIST